MKRKTMLTMALILMIGIANPGYAYNSYVDVKATSWAYAPIKAMSDRGIIKGYPDNSFKPDKQVTYGEFIKMSVVAATEKELELAEKPNHWAQNYYDKALELGYFTMYDIQTAQLSHAISRGDMALIASAILGDVTIENYDEIQRGIKDITPQTKYEYDIAKAYYTGVLRGYTDNTFKPERTLTRAESASVIYRLVDEGERVMLGGASEEAVSNGTKDVKNVVKNIDSFVNPGNGLINENLAEVETYRIITDASKYKMSLQTNRGTNWIQIDNPIGLQQIFLMKNGEILESAQDMPGADGSRVSIYKSDIIQIDYIVSLDIYEHHIDLIVNPFKK